MTTNALDASFQYLTVLNASLTDRNSPSEIVKQPRLIENIIFPHTQ